MTHTDQICMVPWVHWSALSVHSYCVFTMGWCSGRYWLHPTLAPLRGPHLPREISFRPYFRRSGLLVISILWIMLLSLLIFFIWLQRGLEPSGGLLWHKHGSIIHVLCVISPWLHPYFPSLTSFFSCSVAHIWVCSLRHVLGRRKDS